MFASGSRLTNRRPVDIATHHTERELPPVRRAAMFEEENACHLPSCSWPSAIGITSLDRVRTERICEVLSSPPSAVCSK